MNKSAIDWCDYTWNPVTGCLHGCGYCYAEKMTKRFSGDVRLNKMARADYSTQLAANGNRNLYILDRPMVNEKGKIITYPFGFEPTFHRYRMDWLDKLGHGANIFVGAMADIFGDWVPEEWIAEIFEKCKDHPQHNYLFLTKNPQGMRDVPEGDNFWYGCTVTNLDDLGRCEDLPPGRKNFVSIEPILGEIIPTLFKDTPESTKYLRYADWVIIGAETKNRNKVVPEKQWIDDIVRFCRYFGIPVFMKESLKELMTIDFIQEYPPELMEKRLSQKQKNMLYDHCCVCKKVMPKKEMLTLIARKERGDNPKQYGFMCGNCFRDFCEKNGIDWRGLT